MDVARLELFAWFTRLARVGCHGRSCVRGCLRAASRDPGRPGGPKIRLGETWPAAASIRLEAGRVLPVSSVGRTKPGSVARRSARHLPTPGGGRPHRRSRPARRRRGRAAGHGRRRRRRRYRGRPRRHDSVPAGVSIPSERITTSALTAKDRADVPRALAIGADLVAQSFVRTAEDVRDAAELLGPTARRSSRRSRRASGRRRFRSHPRCRGRGDDRARRHGCRAARTRRCRSSRSSSFGEPWIAGSRRSSRPRCSSR